MKTHIASNMQSRGEEKAMQFRFRHNISLFNRRINNGESNASRMGSGERRNEQPIKKRAG